MRQLSFRKCFGICILVFSFFAFFSQGAWGETYTWIGGASGNWGEPANWSPNGVPGASDDVVVDGTEDVTINITSDVTLGIKDNHSIWVNNANSTDAEHTVTFEFSNDAKLEAAGQLWIVYKDNNLLKYEYGASNEVNNAFSGRTTTTIFTAASGSKSSCSFEGLDTPEKGVYTLGISPNMTLTVRGIFYGNTDNNSSHLVFTGTDQGGGTIKGGSLYIPESGANCNWGESKIIYEEDAIGEKILKIYPYVNANPVYSASIYDNGFPDNSVTVTITRNPSSSGYTQQTVKYPYDVEIINNSGTTTEEYSFNNVNPVVAGSKVGDLEIEGSTPSKTFDLICETVGATKIDSDDGIKITIWTPDKSMILAIYEYKQGEIAWTGNEDVRFSNINNWRGINDFNDLKAHLLANDLTINGTANKPEINADDVLAFGEIKLNKLTLTTGASINIVDGGKLTVKQIEIQGTAKVNQTGGDLVFDYDYSSGTIDDFFVAPSEYKGDRTQSVFHNLELKNADATKSLELDGDPKITGTFTNNVAGGIILDGYTLSANKFAGTGKYMLSDTGSDTTKLVCTGTADTEIPGEVTLGDGGSGLIEIDSENGAKFELSKIKTTGTPKIQTSGDVVFRLDTSISDPSFKSIEIESGSLELIGTEINHISCENVTVNNNKITVTDGWLEITETLSTSDGCELTLKQGRIFTDDTVTWDKISVDMGTNEKSYYCTQTNATADLDTVPGVCDVVAKKIDVASGCEFYVGGGNTGTLTLGNSDVVDNSTINGTLIVRFEDFKVDSGKSLTVNGDGKIILNGNFTNSNTTALGASDPYTVTINKLILYPTSATQTLSLGSGVSVGTLIADGTKNALEEVDANKLGGKTINFKGKIVVTKELNFSGKDATSKLTLDGSDASGTTNTKWKIDASGITDKSKKSLKYLTVSNSFSEDKLYPLFSSEGTLDTTENWFFGALWTWKGGASVPVGSETAWSEPENWLLNYQEGHGLLPGYSFGTANEIEEIVEISSVGIDGTTPITDFPVYADSSNVTITSLTVNTDATLLFDDGAGDLILKSFTNEGTATINGKLILKGDFKNTNTANDAVKLKELILNPTDATQKLELGVGVKTEKLIADGSTVEGKTITFSGEITVTDKLVLKGKSLDPDEILTLDRTAPTGTTKWTIKTLDSSATTPTEIENKFLYVKNSQSLDTNGSKKGIVAECSFGEGSENWTFKNSWIWAGGVSESEKDWFKGPNWEVVVDDTQSPIKTEKIKNNEWFPGCKYSTSKTDKVLIPGSLNHYPIYKRTSTDDGLSIASLKIGDGFVSDASLTLNGEKNLKILGKKNIDPLDPTSDKLPDLTIFGTLIIASNTSRVVADFDDGAGGQEEKPINDVKNYGTVQYGDGTTPSATLEIIDFDTGDGLDYAKLIVAKNSDAKLPDAKIVVNDFENKGKLTQEGTAASLNIIRSFTDKTHNKATYEKIVIVGKAETVGSKTVKKAVMTGATNDTESGPKIKSLTNVSELDDEDYQEILFDGYFTITDGQDPDGGTFLFNGVEGNDAATPPVAKKLLRIGAVTSRKAHFYVPKNYVKVSGNWLLFVNEYPTLSYLESTSPKVTKRVYAVPKNSDTEYTGDFPDGWVELKDRYIWIGEGTTSDWNVPENWVGETVPPTADEVEPTPPTLPTKTLPEEIMIVSGNQPIFVDDVISRKFYIAEGMTPYINAKTLTCEKLEIEQNGELNVKEKTPSTPAKISTLIIRQFDVSPTPSVPTVKFASDSASENNAKINVSNGKLIFEAKSDVDIAVPARVEVHFENDIILEGKSPSDPPLYLFNPTVTFNTVYYPAYSATTLPPDLTIAGGNFVLFGDATAGGKDEVRIKNLTINPIDDTVTPEISAGHIMFKTNSGVLIYENFKDEGTFAVEAKSSSETPFLKFAGTGTTPQEFTQNTTTEYCEIQFASGDGTSGTGVKILKDKLKTAKFNLVSGNVEFDGKCEVSTDVADFNGNIFVNDENDETVFTNVTTGVDLAVHVVGASSISVGSGSGTGTKTLTVNGNVFVEMKPYTDSFTVNIPVTVSKNFIAYAGKTVIAGPGSVSTTSGDIVVLGTTYNIDDKEPDVGSGVAGLFAYNLTSPLTRQAAASFTYSLKSASECDGEKYSAYIDIQRSGVALSAGKNFYANGTSLTSSTNRDWTLKLCENDDASKSFAEAYNTTISHCSIEPTVSGKTTILSAAEGCTGATDTTNMIYNGGANGNACGIEFYRPKILTATTKYDDVIEVKIVYDDGSASGSETVCKIENTKGEIAAALSKIVYQAFGNNGTPIDGTFSGVYTDADCTTPIATTADIEGHFYLKASGTWNTDATGTSAGDDFATNRSGNHQTSIPSLKIPRATSSIFSTITTSGKSRIVNYALSTGSNGTGTSDTNTAIYTDTTDGAAPVLIEVSTGREEHNADPAAQTTYDAHNFFELKYSESVNFTRPNADSTETLLKYDENDAAKKDNIALNENFGNVKSTDGAADGIDIAAIAKISSGRMEAASKKSDGTTHSMRRLSENTIRVTVAGYVDGNVTIGGNTFKNWVGYIDSAAAPVANSTVSSVETSYIKDKVGNKIDAIDGTSNAALTNHKLQPIEILIGGKTGNYGTWDTIAPGFAPFRSSRSEMNEWSTFKNAEQYEIVGTAIENSGLPYISQLEFHIFDDEPTYDDSVDTLQWYSKIGWCESQAVLKNGDRNYATKDIQGGLRTSTLKGISNAFKYTTDTSATPNKTFSSSDGLNRTTSSLFLSASGTGNKGDRVDDLYFMLSIPETNLGLNTLFKVSYEAANGPVTDLAGNSLKSRDSLQSLDTTPPAFSFTISPVGKKELFVLVSKPIRTTDFMFDSASGPIATGGLAGIPKSLEIINKDTNSTPTNGLAIDETKPAKIVIETNKTSGFIVYTNQEVTYDDIVNCFVRVKSVGTAFDPLTGISTEISFILDEIENFMTVDNVGASHPSRHAFSDFAVDAVVPLYAYDTERELFSNGIYGDGDWAVRDFSGSGGNMNRLLAGEDYVMQVSKPEEVKKLTMFMSTNPDADSISEEIDTFTGLKYRIWLPKLAGTTFPSFKTFSENENTNYTTEDSQEVSTGGSVSDTLFNFELFQKTDTSGTFDSWKVGSKVQFLFGINDASGNPVTIQHEADGTEYPLYALRLADPNNIMSFDLWQLGLTDRKHQRGNVTILNNVINSANREQTIIDVTMPESGLLNIFVMTLDGNIVKRLEHSNISAGEHFYRWDGTNNAGDAVARGIYFIRVTGSGIDETRKVMVVK